MTRRAAAALAVAFTLLVAVMAAHEAEHVAQVVQKDALGASCPNDCRGLLGFAFDLEWIHFAYNASILAALVALVVGFGLWRRAWRERHPGAWSSLGAGIAIQGYHVVEHAEKLAQWFANGRRSPTPGILGHHFSLVELHFALNTLVFALVLGGYFGFGLHRRLWELRTPRRLALAGAAVALVAVATGFGWEQRPPTIRLAAGVHEGPLVLDRAQRLVGSPGTVVRGGILITADDVVVRDLTVSGGEHGIEVRDAQSVLLERVEVRGAELDGISVRRASVTIRDCAVRSAGDRAQGIDVSFALQLAPSVVHGCTVTGGAEGIVSHLARVHFHHNRVSGTGLRAIAVTEMSMGNVEKNEVRSALGIGIFCGDYSMCEIDQNTVRDTRPDRASGNPTRAGYAIVAHYWANAEVGDNEIASSAAGIGSFINATIERS